MGLYKGREEYDYSLLTYNVGDIGSVIYRNIIKFTCMKYKVGDKVRIKSKDWYEKNKDEGGYIKLSQRYFNEDMCMYCGKIETK